eukprot:GHVL01005636.1.p1 GENE.GHVL01005636.1~~GHVL01005636.1.p1  ORF type:complete len:786 (+),score=134.76 GHVL01005636.1:2142-4499(+)
MFQNWRQECPSPPTDCLYSGDKRITMKPGWSVEVNKTLTLVTRPHRSKKEAESRGILLGKVSFNGEGKHYHNLSCFGLSEHRCDDCVVQRYDSKDEWRRNMTGTIKQMAHTEDMVTMFVRQRVFKQHQLETLQSINRDGLLRGFSSDVMDLSNPAPMTSLKYIGSPGWTIRMSLEEAVAAIMTHPLEHVDDEEESCLKYEPIAKSIKWGCETIEDVILRTANCVVQWDDIICEWCLLRFLHYKQLVLLYAFATKFHHQSGHLLEFLFGRNLKPDDDKKGRSYTRGHAPPFPIVPSYILPLLPPLVLTQRYGKDYDPFIRDSPNNILVRETPANDLLVLQYHVRIFHCLDRLCDGMFSGIDEKSPQSSPVSTALSPLRTSMLKVNGFDELINDPRLISTPSGFTASIRESLINEITPKITPKSPVFAMASPKPSKAVQKNCWAAAFAGAMNLNPFVAEENNAKTHVRPTINTQLSSDFDRKPIETRICGSELRDTYFKKKTFLEIGCALGGSAWCLSQWGWKGMGVTLPPSLGGQQMLHVRQLAPGFQVVWADILKLAVEGETLSLMQSQMAEEIMGGEPILQFELVLCSICGLPPPNRYTPPEGARFECASPLAQLLLALPYLAPKGVLLIELPGPLPKLRTLATIWHLCRIFGPEKIRAYGANDKPSRKRGTLYVVCKDFPGIDHPLVKDFLLLARGIFSAKPTHLEHIPLPKHSTTKQLCAFLEAMGTDLAILWSKQIQYIKDMFPNELAWSNSGPGSGKWSSPSSPTTGHPDWEAIRAPRAN